MRMHYTWASVALLIAAAVLRVYDAGNWVVITMVAVGLLYFIFGIGDERRGRR